jgi:hypothetical protein
VCRQASPLRQRGASLRARFVVLVQVPLVHDRLATG